MDYGALSYFGQKYGEQYLIDIRPKCMFVYFIHYLYKVGKLYIKQ